MRIMETFTGKMVDPLGISMDQIDIKDIAHALAYQCRFNGHCRQFYSVAQHSIMVANTFGSPRMRRFGLLHDAAEAYLGDVITPIKNAIPEFRRYEQIVQGRIFRKFCGRTPTTFDYHQLKEADIDALLAEAAGLLPSCSIAGRENQLPLRYYIFDSLLPPVEAEYSFLKLWDCLSESKQ